MKKKKRGGRERKKKRKKNGSSSPISASGDGRLFIESRERGTGVGTMQRSRSESSIEPMDLSIHVPVRARSDHGDSEENLSATGFPPLSALSPPPLSPGETRSIRSPFRRIRRLYVVQKVWRIAWKRGRNYGSSPNSPPNDDVTISDVDQTRKIDCTWEET